MSHYLCNFIDATEYELPIETGQLFNSERELFLEIGFGAGEFLIQTAAENPRSSFLGIELSMISCHKLLKSLDRRSLENVRVLLVDVSFALDEIISAASVSGIYMNFPCPWPKKRHSGRRLNDCRFAEKLARVLKPEGFFQLYTDSFEFACDMQESINNTGLFDAGGVERNPSKGVNTRYESKWLSMEKDIYRVFFRRNWREYQNRYNGGIDVSHAWLKEEIDIQRLIGVLNEAFIREKLLVKFLKVFLAVEDDSYLIETITADDDQSQRFYICLIRKPSGWLLQLDSQTKPFRTPAVRFAIRKLTEILSKEEQ
jgi:tRNA (guanine-N7-)-methyltransferase